MQILLKIVYLIRLKGEIHSATVYEDSHFTVILDVNPATKGHCLIIPKEHFDNIYDLDGETAVCHFQSLPVLQDK